MKKINKVLLTSYLLNEVSDEEKKLVESWLQENSENLKEFNELKSVIEVNQKSLELPSPEFSSVRSEVLSKINNSFTKIKFFKYAVISLVSATFTFLAITLFFEKDELNVGPTTSGRSGKLLTETVVAQNDELSPQASRSYAPRRIKTSELKTKARSPKRNSISDGASPSSEANMDMASNQESESDLHGFGAHTKESMKQDDTQVASKEAKSKEAFVISPPAQLFKAKLAKKGGRAEDVQTNTFNINVYRFEYRSHEGVLMGLPLSETQKKLNIIKAVQSCVISLPVNLNESQKISFTINYEFNRKGSFGIIDRTKWPTALSSVAFKGCLRTQFEAYHRSIDPKRLIKSFRASMVLNTSKPR